ncbi:hypothetical protein DSO57_1011722 [Entomophthora muscae]|uniref:Uncharacterized protein n=1 Tax=Entomophthora muscae TaxID=34485 RepID=A0ACC2T6F2_9FUNG|nr:hypothetical protein DSO57_1011722 [Entomophthora muscae]
MQGVQEVVAAFLALISRTTVPSYKQELNLKTWFSKQKRRQPGKLTGGFKPPTTHQGRQEAVQTALAYLVSLNFPKGKLCPGASSGTGLGELVAPNSIGAPSPNSIIGLGAVNAIVEKICCKL